MSAAVAMMTSSTPPMVLPEATSPKAAPPGVFANAEEGAGGRPTKLFIGGISRHTTTKQLRDHFSQFGRVLDCVAMRTQDGQPRGFGYVTLDSPVAAQRCLAEPQLIDNRVVDMKQAVPEGSGASPSGASGFSKGANFNMGMDMYSGYNFNEWSAPYGNTQAWWPSQDTQGLDCLDLLNASRGSTPQGMAFHPGFPFGQQDAAEVVANDTLDAMGLLLPPVLSSEQKASPLHADFQLKMSANAAEFVPSAPTSPTAPPGNLLPKNTRKGASANRIRAPLGELTNLVQVGDLLKPFASPSKKKDVAHGHLSVENIAESPGAVTLEDAPAAKQSVARPTGLVVHDESLKETPEKCSSPVSPDETTAGDSPDTEVSRDASAVVDAAEFHSQTDSDSEEEEEIDMDNLPSIGSATHGAGECKRCNFFAKGRCQNGKECSFCHFPHEKRKPSRQEKRERRAEWLNQNEDSQTDETTSPKSATTRAKKAPAPLNMMGLGCSAPPGLAAWQPEVEANAFSFLPMGQPMPGMFDHYGFQNFGSSASSPISSAFLSTVPTPAASAFPTPVATPTHGEAHVMLPGGMSTSGTQTGGYMCKRCDVDGGKTLKKDVAQDAPETEKSGHQWPRDELLRLRDRLMNMPGSDMATRSLPIRTAPNTTAGVM